MTDYVVLSRSSSALDISECAHAVDAVTKMLRYGGSCLYLPVPSAPDKVLLTMNSGSATESETEWFLRSLASYLSADMLSPDGGPLFDGSPDNDTDGIDIVPPPEDEALPIRLFVTFEDVREKDIRSAILNFFIENDYEITIEADGYTVFLAANSYLDIFYKVGKEQFTAEIDCTFSGAGVYAEVVEIAETLAKHLRISVSFVESPAVTYTLDRDFDKLRCAFYSPLRQQLAFAICDDRDGLQAYIGWGTDAFEPQPMKGTVITPFGRYDIERLLDEIRQYGFSAVCDKRFLSRNTPSDGGEFYVKEVLTALWSTPFMNPETELTKDGEQAIAACCEDFETALRVDPYTPFPSYVYLSLCSRIGRQPADWRKAHDYRAHFSPGYMQDEVGYGFGHYLRRFKLPGYIQQSCKNEHRDRVYFYKSFTGGPRVESEISYGYDGDGSDSPLGRNFARGDDIETFDIGGSSVARYVDGGLVNGRYRAEAEIYIKDEVYRFAMTAESHSDVEAFRDIICGSLSVEDWYDEYIREESPDPHAPGGTFCMNLYTPPCHAFKSAFPTGMKFLCENTIAYAGADASIDKLTQIKRLADAFSDMYFPEETDKETDSE